MHNVTHAAADSIAAPAVGGANLRRMLPYLDTGIAGQWQVSGRSGLNFDDMVRLDRLYIENWSLSLDLSILLKTVRAVLGRRGAC